MSHGEGWQFIQIGRAIERSSSDRHTAERVRGRLFGCSAAGAYAGADRRAATSFSSGSACCAPASAFEAYCNVYTADLIESQILEFLLLNKRLSAFGPLLCRQPAPGAARARAGERAACPAGVRFAWPGASSPRSSSSRLHRCAAGRRRALSSAHGPGGVPSRPHRCSIAITSTTR